MTAGGISQTSQRPAIEQTVAGLGYDLVDVERAPRGLLRVTIDRRDGGFVTVDDCERVTRQLQYALEVDAVAYERLEVSSPGLDRPLRAPSDFVRYAGSEITLTLKAPFQGRKNWRGVLQPAAGGTDGWQLLLADARTEQVLAFAFEEVREARLVPVLDFKGRGRAAGAASDGAGTVGEAKQ